MTLEAHLDLINKFGAYHWGQDIKDASGLTEYTEEEYEHFISAGAWVDRPSEQMFSGHEAEQFGFSWTTTIGARNGKIYSISLQLLSQNPAEILTSYQAAREGLTEQMGKAKHSIFSKKYTWESAQGNIVLNQRKAFGFTSVMIVATGAVLAREMGIR